MENANQKTLSSQPSSSNSSWLKTFSIGFSIISFGITLAIVGYVLTTSKNQTVNQQPTITSPTTIQPSPTSTTDETANWKTYTQSGFSFKYPQNWYITTCKGFEGILLDKELRSCATEPSTFKVAIIKLKELDVAFEQERRQNVVVSEKNINIDGKQFMQARLDYGKDKDEGTPPIKYTSTKINVNNAIYRIDLYNQNERKYYDQILSTFQFLN